jgi:hypothetical protein
LEVAKEKARRRLKGAQIIEAHIVIVDKDVVVKLEGVVAGSLRMHKPKKTPHGLTVATNHGRRPIGFTKEEVSRIKELQELKKVELVTLKSSIANILQQKSNLEAKVKHICFQMEDKKTAYVEAKMEMEIAIGKFSTQKNTGRKFASSFDGYVN